MFKKYKKYNPNGICKSDKHNCPMPNTCGLNAKLIFNNTVYANDTGIRIDAKKRISNSASEFVPRTNDAIKYIIIPKIDNNAVDTIAVVPDFSPLAISLVTQNDTIGKIKSGYTISPLINPQDPNSAGVKVRVIIVRKTYAVRADKKPVIIVIKPE